MFSITNSLLNYTVPYHSTVCAFTNPSEAEGIIADLEVATYLGRQYNPTFIKNGVLANSVANC